MNYQKYHKTEVAGLLLHDARGIDCPDTHNHSNENIDRSRTHLNYDLKDRGGLTAYQYYQKRLDYISDITKERGGKAIRKDAVTLCSWVVTFPKTLPKDKYSDFFKGVYKFFAERYGEENIVTADVHKDEKTDHIHLDSVPIVYDKKKGFEKLCAKDLETQRTLAKVHGELQKYLEAELGCAVDILNGATVNGNKSVAELKLETTLKKVSESEKKLDELNEKISEAEKALDEKLKAESERLKVETERLVVEQKAEIEERISEVKKSLDTVETARDEKLFEKGKGVRAVLEKVQGSKKVTAEEQARIENLSAIINEVVSACERKSFKVDEEVEERAEVLCKKRMSSDRKGYSDIINRQKKTNEELKKTNEEQMKQIEQLHQQLALLQREQQRLSEYRSLCEDLEDLLNAFPDVKEKFVETGFYDEFEKLGYFKEKGELCYE